ncbi:MAG: Methenyltetrahydromethanopterin cyclohydrolase Mch [Candidatus Methanohalarchaeum thermophilum]|uniref:Methenyltetrahydromethanopterin cyclohydrolase n=1 Tax=Methanohalarchaeum thermophilum TaxID=1903181 RepID=A0A1Q6DUX8_METT1|nr:MAG: Methenyltetrahydromethanopterin cyclohydrolase Mch [Candidatus Methanohalarchaeum thermophilum]
MNKINLNDSTYGLIEELLGWSDELGVKLKERLGASIFDFSAGGYEAGLIFSEVCLGGVSTVGLTEMNISQLRLPAVQINTGLPVLSCYKCQKADWKIEDKIASGPAKLVRSEKEDFVSDIGILALESAEEPDKDDIREISNQCGVDPSDLFILYAPVDSLVGSIQVAARVIETSLFKLDALGYDIDNVESAFGTAPIPPVSSSEKIALAKTNDSIIYGGSVNLNVKEDFDFSKVPSDQSSFYGEKMEAVFSRFDYKLHEVDEDVFAPAKIVVNNLDNGKFESYGKINNEVLLDSFGLKEES